MPSENILVKVHRVYKTIKGVHGPHGKIYRYLLWMGWYWEDGKRKNVYLGRELPDSLRDLVGKKQFKRSPGNPNFPSSIRRAQKRVAAA